MKHHGVLFVEEITMLETLPYWRDFERWSDHLGDCETCGQTLEVDSQELDVLCPTGLALQEEYSNMLRAQTTLASLN